MELEVVDTSLQSDAQQTEVELLKQPVLGWNIVPEFQVFGPGQVK